jgi:glutaredoxin
MAWIFLKMLGSVPAAARRLPEKLLHLVKIANARKPDYGTTAPEPPGGSVTMAWSWSWLRPWRRPAAVPEQVRVVMYTRRGCHLCADAWKILQDAQQRFRFVLEKVDVDSAADLAAQHGNWVPVVMVNGRVRFRGGVNAVLLGRLLRAEAARLERAER